MTRCLAIIPARGGSKGLPGKNIRPLAGLPLLVHALECARAAGSVLARTIVSTDSEEIADVARRAGGDVPFLRPAELAGDRVPTMPVLVHALDEL
ncbi:MAG: acylneuraminate cytidylyltransferase family protein, partial [Kofleriaceae bacterium]